MRKVIELFLVTSFLMLLVVVPVGASYYGNMIPNPSFEEGVDNQKPLYWGIYGAQGSSNMNVVKQKAEPGLPAYDGEHYLKVIKTDVASNWGAVQIYPFINADYSGPNMDVVAEGTYMFRVRVKAPSGGKVQVLLIRRPNYSHVEGSAIPLEAGADWKEIEFTVQAFSDTQFVQIQLRFLDPSTYYVDKAELRDNLTPNNLSAKRVVNSTGVALSWQHGTGTSAIGLRGYNIWRSDDPDFAAPIKINNSELTASATSFIDSSAGSQSYYYSVEPVSTKNRQRNRCEITEVGPAGSLKGKVIDDNGEPLAGVTVQINGAVNYSIESSLDGTYIVTNLPVGSYFLRYHKMQFGIKEGQATINPGEETELLPLTLSRDIKPPENPTELVASTQGPGLIKLMWYTGSLADEVEVRYEVYRTEASNPYYKEAPLVILKPGDPDLEVFPHPTDPEQKLLVWVDKTGQGGKTYFYHIFAIDAASNRSAEPSNEVNIAVIRPKEPILLKPDPQELINGTLTFEWECEEEVATYLLEASQNANFSGFILKADFLANTKYAVPENASEANLYLKNMPVGIWFWRVRAKLINGAQTDYSQVRSFSLTNNTNEALETGIPQFIVEPESLLIKAGDPNQISMRFAVTEKINTGPIKVTIKVFNLAGQLVATLMESEEYHAGVYSKVWSCINNNGRIVEPGLYLIWLGYQTFDNKKISMTKKVRIFR